MNCRSVSVNGLSADVRKSTRSERGTKSVVNASCSRMIAFVPGVSTTCTVLSSSTGAVTTWIPWLSVERDRVSPYFSTVT